MVELYGAMGDPISLITDFDFSKDIKVLTQGAEVAENLVSTCHFEQPMVDLMTFCESKADPCTISNILDNLKKDMFVLMGKLTSIAETVKEDFPSDENEDFAE